MDLKLASSEPLRESLDNFAEVTPPIASVSGAPAPTQSESAGKDSSDNPIASTTIDAEVRRHHSTICARIDRHFAWLMIVQWLAAIAVAQWISPHAWAGGPSYLHSYVTLAILYGGVLTFVPVALTRIAPGQRITRLTIGVMQMLMSCLLIHLSGGRIETHFHILGSLAFLAFYLDWEVLVAASAVVALDHFLRGLYLPYSVFGSSIVQPWRWLEHVGWIVFCDIFLIIGCNDRMSRLRAYTIRQAEREELLRRAHFDALTGLPNRSLLSEKISELIRQSIAGDREDGFSCLYIDLDRFKDVNDQAGHAAGDRLMQMAVARIQNRLGDGLVLARLGSDEFVALVPHSISTPYRGEETARAILRSLVRPFELDGRQWILGASIGISHFPQHGQDETELLSHSDKAMYRVKRFGRNDYLVYSPAWFEQAGEREVAERQLRRAIAEGEFELFYQPIFHASGVIAGLEALVRWIADPTDPIHGIIPPSYFIPLAEETGLIVQLGSFVLHEACKQASEWRSRSLLSGSIAVNVSSVELAREDFASAVILILRQHYTPSDAIELEVTESAIVNDFTLAERHLRELRREQIRISIDDFGTGYSSFSRLRQLTLDTLKIDRLFVEGVATSEPDRTVVEHIIAMAHTLGMNVIAEGVETENQRQILCSLGCNQLQGFLLARPMNREQTEQLLIQTQAQRHAVSSAMASSLQKHPVSEVNL